MKRISILFLLVSTITAFSNCKKGSSTGEDIRTPRTSVPAELVGRWAITSISGSTVYNIPSGTTYNTNEVFLGYTINADGTTQEHGYASTYQYGVSTWAKWIGVGSAELSGKAIRFHRSSGTYTSSRSSAVQSFGSNEVYPNKTFTYASWEVGPDSKGRTALFLYDANGGVHTFVKQ